MFVHSRQVVLAISAAALATAGVAAQDGVQSAAEQTKGALSLERAFGMREDITNASLSPDGRKLALIASRAGQGSAVMVIDLEIEGGGTPRTIVRADGDPERISGCRWPSNDRLLCTIYGITRVDGRIAYTSRVVGIDSDGSDIKTLAMPQGFGVSLFGGAVIDWNPGEDGNVLMIRDRLATARTGSKIGAAQGGLGVDLVDTRTMRARPVELGEENAGEFITDGRGTLRITGRYVTDNGYATGERRYFYRMPNERRWLPLSTVSATGEGFDPYGVDPTRNIVYGRKKVGGRFVASSISLDGALREETVYAHPRVDVSGFARIGRNGRIVGATYSTEKPEVQYFDPALAKLSASLRKALPKTPLIRFVDSSEDEQRLLLWVGADNDPGRYYLFDRKASALSPLLADRFALEGRALAAMKPVTYPASDGVMVPGYLTLPPGKEDARGLPALVMPHGGPGSRDEWGFDWLAQYFAAKGYAVLQPNFRGSTGYGDDWFKQNGFKSWPIAIGDVNDAGRWLVKQGIADPAKLGVFGWSYGGYAALQSQVVDPALFKAVVAVAPVTDLERLVEDARNYSNQRMVRDLVGTGPHVAQGSPARFAGRFAAPVLIFHGDEDKNVSIGHGRLMHTRLQSAGKSSQLVVYPRLDHYLEDSDARTDMLTKASAFLAEKLK